jgi:radical SAM protein with 4Fe4S-binding SPASM domain
MDFSTKGKYFFTCVLARPTRLINLAEVKFSKLFRLQRVFGMPTTLMIEPTNFCNLKCPLCPTGLGLIGREKGQISFEDFKKVFDQFSSYIIHLRLWNWGEPLLNKDLFKMISYAKKQGVFVNTSTNSFFLTKDNAAEIVKTGLDEIIVSLDGASEKTYRKYRKNGSFKKVIEALQTLVAEKKRQNTKFPAIKLQFIVMKHNEHEINDAIKLAKKIGVDSIFFKTVGVMDISVYEPIKDYLPQNPRLRRYSFQTRDLRRNFCDYLWEETTINVDGSVVPCCRDSHNGYVFGNVFKQPFKEIWNNKKYVDFRKQVLEDKTKIPLCQGCKGSKKELRIREINFQAK